MDRILLDVEGELYEQLGEEQEEWIELFEEHLNGELQDANDDEKLELLNEEEKELDDELLHGELTDGEDTGQLEELFRGLLSDEL